MNHISNKALKVLQWILIIYCSHFLILYTYFALKYHRVDSAHGYIPELAIIVLFQLIYEVASIFVWKDRPQYQATLVTICFVFLETAFIINTTGSYLSLYFASMVLIVFVAGALGQAWSLGFFFAIFLAYLFSLAGFFSNNEGGSGAGLIMTSACFLAMVLSYWYWHHWYQDDDNPAVQQINRMLKSRKEQSEIIIQSIADGVIVFDNAGKITLINKSAAAMAEWEVEECIGIDIHLVVKLLTEDGKEIEKDKDPFKTALQRGEHVNQILKLTGKKQRQTIVSLVVSPVELEGDSEVVGGVAVLRDFTQQRVEENKRADFISTASHEMRTPVAAIEGYLSLAMNDKVSNIDSKARDYLEKAHESTKQLGKLFQDLLTSSRAEDGRLVSHPIVVEMGEFIQKLSESFSLAAQKKRLLVDFMLIGDTNTKSASGTPITGKVVRPLFYVHVDPDRIQEVITNLFDNAVKYTPNGKITIGINGDNQSVFISIKDSGIGIPADDIPHLFQKFYRVDNSAVRTIGGTGLGLYICKKIVELYNGKIWAESVLDHGSTFHISLPRLSTQQAQNLKLAEEAQNQLVT